MREQDPATAAKRLSAPMLTLIGLCSLVYFLDGLVHTVMGPLAPEVARDLTLTSAQLGPIFSANLIGQCVGLVSVPLAAARFSHRAVVIVTLLGFGLAQGLTGMASTAGELFAFRLVTGVFLGGCLPSCLALVTACAPPTRRGMAIMLLFTGYGLGATAAGFVAAMLEGFGGWKTTMAAIGLACALSGVAAMIWLKEIQTNQGEEPLEEALYSGTSAIFSRRFLAGTLALWILFIAMLTISYCLNSWLPILLVEVGHDESIAAISVSIFSFGGIVAALGIGLLIDRFGAMRVLILALFISTALLVVLGQFLATMSAAMLLVLLGICGFFVLGAYGGINVVLAGYYPHALRALGIGWAKSVSRLGTVLAPILIGFGLDRGVSGSMIISLFAVPAAIAAFALIGISLAQRRRVRPERMAKY
ncbi:MAG TPA: MFS transporter [Sphingobium sp.]